MESLRKGLLDMVEAGAAPKLQSAIAEEYGPPPLLGIPACPDDFGVKTPTVSKCQLQSVSPNARCQLQNVRVSTKDVTLADKLNTQDVAIIGKHYLD